MDLGNLAEKLAEDKKKVDELAKELEDKKKEKNQASNSDLEDELKLKVNIQKEELEIKVDKKEESVTFAVFKKKIRDACMFDKILKQVRISFYEDASQMIMYQGTRTNVIGRIKSNGRHTIYRAAVKKRLQDILDLEIKN